MKNFYSQFKSFKTISKVAVIYSLILALYELGRAFSYIHDFVQQCHDYGESVSNYLGYMFTNAIDTFIAIPAGIIILTLLVVRFAEGSRKAEDCQCEKAEEGLKDSTESTDLPENEEAPELQNNEEMTDSETDESLNEDVETKNTIEEQAQTEEAVKDEAEEKVENSAEEKDAEKSLEEDEKAEKKSDKKSSKKKKAFKKPEDEVSETSE